MVPTTELRRIADGVIQALEGVEQETKELHEVLCAVGDIYNMFLAEGKDREEIEKRRTRFKEARQKWLLNRHAANVYAGCQKVIGLLDEFGW